MAKYFKFHYYNCFIYILIKTLSHIGRYILRDLAKKYFTNKTFNLFIVFFGESLSLIFYLCGKKDFSSQYLYNETN